MSVVKALHAKDLIVHVRVLWIYGHSEITRCAPNVSVVKALTLDTKCPVEEDDCRWGWELMSTL